MKNTFNLRKPRAAGLSPGTFHSEEKNEVTPTEKTEIHLLYYDSTSIEEKQIENVDECLSYKDRSGVSWINVEGKISTQQMERFGSIFNLHPLLLEDIVCGGQRPKVDEYEDHIFVVVKMLRFDIDQKQIKSEQVSFVVGSNYVLSFQEEGIKGDVFNPNRERLRTNKGRIRKGGADYLIYTLIDTIVDNYFHILEKIGEHLEEMEMELISNPSPNLLKSIYRFKREIILLRKSVWPLREVISRLERDGLDVIKPSTRVFIRDVYDHTIQVIETVETYRDIVAGMLDIYLSSISNKMNSVMKVLTMISTIFIPLTFIVGVYGMNFKYMPELEMKHAYAVVWLVMLTIVLLMIWYFRKKKWF